MSELEDEFLKRHASGQSGCGPLQVTPDYQDQLRCDAEWRHWEDSGKWEWNESKKRRWAEGLWRGQHKRRKERSAMNERLRKRGKFLRSSYKG